VNQIYRKLIFLILRATLIPYLVREVMQRHKVTIVAYHNLDPRRADIHFNVLKRAYNIISLRDYLRARDSERLFILPQKALIITFDDGSKDNYLLKPIIEKYKIPITIFLCSGIIGTNRQFWWNYDEISNINRLKAVTDNERIDILANLGFNESKEIGTREALNKNEIEELASTGLVDFQCHTVTHPCLPKCSEEKASFEIFNSKKQLESNFNCKVYAISYPNGDYSDRDVELVMLAGYECALTVDPGFNDEKTNLFKLRRFGLSDSSDVDELLVKTCGFWAFSKRFFMGQDYGYQRTGGKS